MQTELYKYFRILDSSKNIEEIVSEIMSILDESDLKIYIQGCCSKITNRVKERMEEGEGIHCVIIK